MFDIGFSELVLLMIVILLVVGPERLPRVARTAGLYLGRARRMIATVKADVARELAAEDLKRTLQKQAESAGLHDILEETHDAATATEQLFKTDAPAVKPATPALSTADTPVAPTSDTKHGGD